MELYIKWERLKKISWIISATQGAFSITEVNYLIPLVISPPPHTHTPLGCIFIVCAAFCLNEQSSHTRRLDEPDSLRLYTLCISMAAAQNLKLASPLGFLHVGVENGGLLKGSGKAFDGIICTCFSGQQLKQATTAATLHVKKSHRRKVCSRRMCFQRQSSLLRCSHCAHRLIFNLLRCLDPGHGHAHFTTLCSASVSLSLSLHRTRTLITNIYCCFVRPIYAVF